MNAISLTACIVAVWSLATREQSLLRSFLLGSSPPPIVARLAFFALVPLYVAQLAMVRLESHLQSAVPSHGWVFTLPIPIFDDRLPTGASYASLGLGISFLETALVALIVTSLRQRAAAMTNRLVLGIVCALALLSIAAPALSTTDPYEYAATGLIGFQGYAPTDTMFAGTVYETYQKLVPLKGVIYGPLWILIDMAQTSLGSSIYQKIETIRIVNVGFVIVFLWLLSRVGISRAALVGFAINPALWFYAVANPHADIEGLVFLTAAYAAARRSKAGAAILFLVASGLIKLPFVFIGGVLLAPLAGAGRRFRAWGTAIAFTLFISYALPGPAYLTGLLHFAGRRASNQDTTGWLIIVSLIACVTIVSIAMRWHVFGAAWLFQQLPSLAFPWYVLWGVPYALASGTCEVYAISLPAVASLVSESASAVELPYILILLFVCLAVDYLLTNRHGKRLARANT